MGKPTQTLAWTATGNKTDPSAIGTTGYASTDLVASEFTNWQLANITEWQQFVDRAFGKTYYVQCTSGSDTTGDGTSSYPFQTIKKAMDSVESGGYGTIRLAESGTYTIGADISYTNKKISIIEELGVISKVCAVSYVKSYENWLYMIKMNGINYLSIAVDEVEIPSPSNTGVDWYQYAGLFNIQTGLSKIEITTLTKLSFSNTSATGSDYPSLIVGTGTSILDINGTIDTNSKGYVLDTRSRLHFIGGTAIIDSSDYWIKNATGSNTILSLNVSSISGTETAITPTIHRLLTAAADPTWLDSAQTFNVSDSAGDVNTKAGTLINTAYPEIPTSAVTGQIIKNFTDSYIAVISIFIDSDYAEYVLSDPIVAEVDSGYYHFSYKKGRKNINIVTNIPELM